MKKKVILSINQCYFWIDYLILYLLIKKSSYLGFLLAKNGWKSLNSTKIGTISRYLFFKYNFEIFEILYWYWVNIFNLIILTHFYLFYSFRSCLSTDFYKKKIFLKWVDLYTKMLKIKLKYWVRRLFEKNSNQYHSDKGLLMNKVKVKRSKWTY